MPPSSQRVSRQIATVVNLWLDLSIIGLIGYIELSLSLIPSIVLKYHSPNTTYSSSLDWF